jgi:hypothetical protein
MGDRRDVKSLRPPKVLRCMPLEVLRYTIFHEPNQVLVLPANDLVPTIS